MFAEWRGDLRGGVTAAFAALPVELVYGMFAVAPLSAAYGSHGLRAALWGCVVCGLLAFVLRGTGGMLTGTRPATGLILGTLAANLLYHPAIEAASNPEARVFVLLLLCTALAGFFQWLFGMLNVGRALKYIPFPVTAGLTLGVAALMIIGSLRPALGADGRTPWLELLTAWHPFSLVVAGVTLAFCILATRRRTAIPPTILALLAGTLTHHLLVALLGAERLGATLPAISDLLPERLLINAGMPLHDLLGWLPVLSSYALTIAAFASLETLLCLSTLGNARGSRPEADRELRVQGLSNLVAGLCGATASAGNLSRVNVNLAAGGRTSLSAVVYALTLVAVVVLAGSLLAWVPAAVTAAIVIHYALIMVDDGTHRLVEQLVLQRAQIDRGYYRVLLANFGVIVLVAAVAVFGDMMKAVGIGIAAAMFLFVRTRMKPVIRRISHAGERGSLKLRTTADAATLKRAGESILVVEVEGPLFFGTADNLAKGIFAASTPAEVLVLDLARMTDIDPTGARTLLQTARRLRAQGKQVMVSGASPHFRNFLATMGLEEAVPVGGWYPDLDHALEEAEDRLLEKLGGATSHRTLELRETALAAGLDAEELAALARVLRTHSHAAACELFHIGDPGDSLYVSASSAVDILVPRDNGHLKRIVCLAPGVIFGEMGFLEGAMRSTSAHLQEPSLVWELDHAGLDALLKDNPRVARKVFFNIGCQLAGRLRSLTQEVMLLENR